MMKSIFFVSIFFNQVRFYPLWPEEKVSQSVLSVENMCRKNDTSDRKG